MPTGLDGNARLGVDSAARYISLLPRHIGRTLEAAAYGTIELDCPPFLGPTWRLPFAGLLEVALGAQRLLLQAPGLGAGAQRGDPAVERLRDLGEVLPAPGQRR